MAQRDADRPSLLREFLSGADVPCPACGYSLRGLQGSECPECGEALCLRVGMVEPRMGLYLAGLIGLSVGLGFHGILFVWAGWMVLAGRGGPNAGDFVPIVTGLTLCGVSLGAWLQSRARIRRLPETSARRLVGACWALTAVTSLLFMAVVG